MNNKLNKRLVKKKIAIILSVTACLIIPILFINFSNSQANNKNAEEIAEEQWAEEEDTLTDSWAEQEETEVIPDENILYAEEEDVTENAQNEDKIPAVTLDGEVTPRTGQSLRQLFPNEEMRNAILSKLNQYDITDIDQIVPQEALDKIYSLRFYIKEGDSKDITNLSLLTNIKDLTVITSKEGTDFMLDFPSNGEKLQALKNISIVGVTANDYTGNFLGSLNNLSELAWYSYSADKFPEGVMNSKSIEILSIEFKNLESLPNSISNLKTLKKLQISSSLHNLPKSIVELKDTLESLSIGSVFYYTIISDSEEEQLQQLMPNLKISIKKAKPALSGRFNNIRDQGDLDEELAKGPDMYLSGFVQTTNLYGKYSASFGSFMYGEKPVDIRDFINSSGKVIQTAELWTTILVTVPSTPNDLFETRVFDLDKIEGNYIGKNRIVIPLLAGENITVQYLDIDTGEPVADPAILEGKHNSEYQTNFKEVANYTLVADPGKDKKGKFTTSPQTFTYYYQRHTNLTVEYFGTDGSVLHDPIISTAYRGTPYKTERKEFTGYRFKEVLGNPSGSMELEDFNITYLYDKLIKVQIDHVDTRGNLIADSDLRYGVSGETYDARSKLINGYTLVKQPDTVENKFTDEDLTISYVYAKNSTVKAEYVDEEGNELLEPIIYAGTTGMPYLTQVQLIPGYTLAKTPLNAGGYYTDDEQIITYVYTKHITVIAQYLNTKGEKLVPDVILTGTKGDTYSVPVKKFKKYTLLETPENVNGTFGTDKETVALVYTEKSVVTVMYLDENEKELAPSVKLIGTAGDNYVSQVKAFKGYQLNESPENATGLFIEEEQTVKYVYHEKEKSKGSGKAGGSEKSGTSNSKKGKLPTTGENNYSLIIASILGSLIILAVLVFYIIKLKKASKK